MSASVAATLPSWNGHLPPSLTKRIMGFDVEHAHLAPPPGGERHPAPSQAEQSCNFPRISQLSHESPLLSKPNQNGASFASWSAYNSEPGCNVHGSPYQVPDHFSPSSRYHDSQIYSSYSLQSMTDPLYSSLPASVLPTQRKIPISDGLRPVPNSGPSADRHSSSGAGSNHTSPEQPTLDMIAAHHSAAALQPSSYQPMLTNEPFGPADAVRVRSSAASMAASAPPDLSLGLRPTISVAHRRQRGGNNEEGAPRQSDVATEKKRKRRESHNMVERRRRDGINLAIQQLSELLPEQMLEPVGTGQTTHHTHHKTGSINSVLSNSDSGPGTPADMGMAPSATVLASGSLAALRPNKSIVLQKAVDYMRYLKHIVDAQSARNSELEQIVQALQKQHISGGSRGTNVENDRSAFSFAHVRSTEGLFSDDGMQD